MKKIKEYINNKPRLKKTIKVLAVIGVIFSVGFNIFIIGVGSCASYYQNKEAKANVEPTITTPLPKKSIEGRFNIVYFLSDFTSISFIEDTYTILTDDSMTNIGGRGYSSSDFLSGELLSFDLSSTPAQFGYIDTNGSGFGYYADISIVTITCQYLGNSYGAHSYQIIIPYQLGADSHRLVFTYCLYQTGTTTQWNSVGVYQKYLNSTWTNVSLGPSDCTAIFNFAKDISINWMGTGKGVYNEAYNLGYEDGLNTGLYRGENQGYENGYNSGYYDGLSAAEEGETTMFTLVKSAFDSISSILNIQVLPNLSLGLLIFAPIIFTIIIVIIKMIKG